MSQKANELTEAEDHLLDCYYAATDCRWCYFGGVEWYTSCAGANTYTENHSAYCLRSFNLVFGGEWGEEWTYNLDDGVRRSLDYCSDYEYHSCQGEKSLSTYPVGKIAH